MLFPHSHSIISGIAVHSELMCVYDGECNLMDEKTRCINSLRDIFVGWENNIPAEVAEYLFSLALQMPISRLQSVLKRFPNPGREWGYHPYEPFCREIVGALVDRMTTLSVHGAEQLIKAAEMLRDGVVQQVVLLPNHRSYSDGNVLALLVGKLLDNFSFSDELTVVVGPKVFATPFKSCASMQFNSIKIAQSTAVATKDVSVSIKEVAKATRIAIDAIKEKVRLMLVFPEGSRSRDNKLKRFLPGVYRLLSVRDSVALVPVGITGGNKLLPISSSRLQYASLSIAFGTPVLMSELQAQYGIHDKVSIMDDVGRRVASLLPIEERGVYGK